MSVSVLRLAAEVSLSVSFSSRILFKFLDSMDCTFVIDCGGKGSKHRGGVTGKLGQFRGGRATQKVNQKKPRPSPD